MPAIILTHGLPTSGKSTIVGKIKANLANSDIPSEIIKTVNLRDKDSLTKVGAAFIDESNPQTKKEKDDSYKAMIDLAKTRIAQGIIPILDATFHKKERRSWIYELKKEFGIPIYLLFCEEPQLNEVKECLTKRISHSNKEDNILNSLEQFNLMKIQQDTLNETEIEENELKLISFNRSTKIMKLSNFDESVLSKSIIRSIKNV